MKTKSLIRIEEKLQTLEEGSYRYEALDACRRFKTTWMELGRTLVGVHRDKMFREWGFQTFEAYCAQELGIKQPTALKLVRSYGFLENEEPTYLRKMQEKPEPGNKCAELDSVNALRLAKKNKRINDDQYTEIRRGVLEEAKEPKEVVREIRMLSSDEPPPDPTEARADRRFKFLKQFIKQLESAKTEAMASRLLPGKIIDQIDDLSQLVEKELERG